MRWLFKAGERGRGPVYVQLCISGAAAPCYNRSGCSPYPPEDEL